jgi:hypothetical protein
MDVGLALGPYIAPQLLSFTLINADAFNGVRRNKIAAINQTSGIITFANTSFTTISVNTIINFHSLIANFTLSQGSKLYVEDTEQITGVTANNYNQEEIFFTVVAPDNARKTYRVAGRSPGGTSVVGTTSWQTQGFGVLHVETTDLTTGMPITMPGTPHPGKLNLVWNTTGTFVYISPEGDRVETGRTDIRGRGNWSWRRAAQRSYSIRFNQAIGIDYYDYKTNSFRTLPEHRRWQLLAHGGDPSRIRNTLAHEMGRHVLTNMGWQPHADWVFFFLNGRYMGVYIISESIRPDEGRMGLTPIASGSNRNGGFIVEINNTNWYGNDMHGQNNEWIFEDVYNFMSSHQNPVRNASGNQGSTGDMKMQGVVFSMSQPDSNLGWYYPDPPTGTGNLTYSNTTHFPRRAIAMMATLTSGTEYNRRSRPASEWIVPNDFGSPNGMGTPGMLLRGTVPRGQDGGIFGTRTLAQVFPNHHTSTFVHMAQLIQNAEDAIYAREWGLNGVGGYHDHIDIDSFIDFQIGMEMTSNWEMIAMNGFYMHYCPTIRKFKMGPLWDKDNAWNSGDNASAPGFVGRTPFWYKELLGFEITGTNPGNATQGNHILSRRDPYYAARLADRWEEVRTQFNTELNAYIDAIDARFNRIRTYSHPISVGGNRQDFKNRITTRRNQLDPIMRGYRP